MQSDSGARTRWVFHLVATAAIYWIAGRLALLMAIPPGYATAVWPAAGFALVCVLNWGPRVLPGIALASLLLNVGTSFDGSNTSTIVRSLAIATLIGLGAAVQAQVGSICIRYAVGFPTSLESNRDIIRLTLLGGPVACAVSATIGTATLLGFGVVAPEDAFFGWCTWWVGDTIGVLIFAPLALLFVPPIPDIWPHRRTIVGVPLLLGFAAISFLFVRVSAWEDHRLAADFERRSVALGNALEDRLSMYEGVVTSLVSFFDASPEVTRSSFRRFTHRALEQYPGIQALSWNPRVSDAEREDFEQRARSDGLSQFEFTEAGNGGLRRARSSSIYVPIYFIEPEANNRRALGFNTASEPRRTAASHRAAETGALVTVAPIELVSRGVDGVLLMAPVFSESPQPERPHLVRGYVVGIFRMHNIVETAVRTIDHSGMSLRLTDRSLPPSDRVLYSSPNEDAEAQRGVSRTWTRRIAFGDHTWDFRATTTPSYIATQRSWQAWMVLAGGLFFVGMLGIVLLMSTGGAARSHRDLQKRSAEAARAIQAEAKFRSAIEAAPTGMLAVDRHGKIVLINRQVEGIFGYPRDELVGQPLSVLIPQRLQIDHAAHVERYCHEPTMRPMAARRDLVGIRKDGTEVPLEIGLNPLPTPDGDLVLSSVADISERKRYEAEREALTAELKTLNASLEERVRVRTHDLATALKEREVLLQEVHHRVKNNLQVISSLINMQIRTLEGGSDRDALRECQLRVQAIALIHEKLYQAQNHARIPFADYARSLAENIFHAAGLSAHHVTLEVLVGDFTLPVDKAIPCGLLLNELITNALKHAFPDGRRGTVRVELYESNGRMCLTVSDDGIGLPLGFDVHKSESMGAQLISTLAEQLDAELEVSGGKGTSLRLTFP